ncbi:MAG: pilus assembly protein PilM [Microthrixaceae bacterium]|nr:pilus assembly protein PilM [Microthrixaceae bacterium]
MRWVRSNAGEDGAPVDAGQSTTLMIEPLPLDDVSPLVAAALLEEGFADAGVSEGDVGAVAVGAAAEPTEPEAPKLGGRRASRSGYGQVAGLVISADRVRVCHGAPGRDLRTGEIELPEGVIVEGELRDPEALSAALRTLWRTARIPTRKVALSVANHDVVSRNVTLPQLSNRDMRSALRFELVEAIPFPVEDATFDLQVTDTELIEDTERVQVHVLAIAALSQMCQDFAGAMRAAKLRPKGIDYVGFSLVRAVAAVAPTDVVECVVEPGEGALTVAVHQRGTVRFARTVLTHSFGSSVSGEIEDQLNSIEQFRQGAVGRGGSRGEQVSPLAMRGDPLAEAVRATIEYYGSQSGAKPIERITVVGSAESARNLATYLQQAVGVPTGLASPLRPDVGRHDIDLDEDHGPGTTEGSGEDAAASSDEGSGSNLDAFTVAYGVTLEVGGQLRGPAPLALLPERPDARGAKRTILTMAGGAVAAALLLMGVASVAGPDVDSATAETEIAETQRTMLESQLAELEGAQEASREHRRLGNLESDLREQQVDWNRLIGEIRQAAPAGVDVLTIEGAAPIKDGRDSAPGVVEVRGTAADQLGVSTYLASLDGIEGLVRPWLTSATAEADAGPDGRLNFGLKAELGKSALVAEPQEETR